MPAETVAFEPCLKGGSRSFGDVLVLKDHGFFFQVASQKHTSPANLRAQLEQKHLA